MDFLKSLIFILHVFQYYYLNIKILKFYETEIFWKFWNLMKILNFFEKKIWNLNIFIFIIYFFF